MTMEQIECDFCGQTFDSVEQLESHQEVLHSDELRVREMEEAVAGDDDDDGHSSEAAALRLDEEAERQKSEAHEGMMAIRQAMR